jgi:hypothetical protein
MSTSTTATKPVTVTLTLNADQIQGLSAMVELGTQDRREFLGKYAAENDYTDEDIAQGHYEADSADSAVTLLTDAFSAAKDAYED